MKPRRPSPSSPSEPGGAPDLAAGLAASIDSSAPAIAAELSVLLRQSIQVTTDSASGLPVGERGPLRGRPGVAASVTIDFQGDLAGRGMLMFDHVGLARLAAWLPAATMAPSPPWARTAPTGTAASRPSSCGMDDRPTAEVSEPLVCCALLEIGSVVLGDVLSAFVQRSGAFVSFGLPRWQGATGPATAGAALVQERLAVPLRLSSPADSLIVWLDLLLHDVRARDDAVDRSVMA